MKKTYIKTYLLFSFLLFFILFFTFNSNCYSYAENNDNTANQNEINEEIVENEVDKQLEDFDFSSLDDIIKNLIKEQYEIFNSKSFIEKIKSIISGDFDRDKNIFIIILDIFFNTIKNLMPLISVIISVSILGSMINGLKSRNNKSINNVIFFITYTIVATLIISILARMIHLTSNTIQNIKSQMDAIFPILLTMLTAVGGSISASIYQPAMALFVNIIMNLFTYVLLPIFIFSVIFNIISNLSNTIKLEKFSSFLNSSYKWIIGLIFTIFTSFISIQGITAGSLDGISIKTAKFAMKSYIPILGSYLSDGMGVILVSSNLIKNAVGASGLLLLLATIISPLIELILLMLALKFIAGIVEPLGNKQVSNLAYSLSKSITLLIALIVGIAFSYFIILGLVMCSANLI